MYGIEQGCDIDLAVLPCPVFSDLDISAGDFLAEERIRIEDAEQVIRSLMAGAEF